MKFLLKLFLFLVVFYLSVLIFLPKEKLYNLAEENIASLNIIVSNEKRKENMFSLDLDNMDVYYDGINVALIKTSKLSSFLFFTKVKVEDIKISNSLKNMFPDKIENLELKHSILNPNKVDIFSKGVFGEFEAEFLILENKILGELKPSNIMKSKYRNILKQFKLKEGRYYYEYKL